MNLLLLLVFNTPCVVDFFEKNDAKDYVSPWINIELEKQPNRQYLTKQIGDTCPFLAFQSQQEPPFFLYDTNEGLVMLKGGSIRKISKDKIPANFQNLLEELFQKGTTEYYDSVSSHPSIKFLSILQGETWGKIVYQGDPIIKEDGGVELLFPEDKGIREIVKFCMELDQLIQCVYIEQLDEEKSLKYSHQFHKN